MTDLISRQAAIDEIEHEIEMINSALDSMTLDFNARERLRQRKGEAREILNSIQVLPSAEPVKHGKWIDDGQYDNFFPHHEWRCSECGEHVLEIGTPWFKYCPNCGARMDEE